MFHVKHPTQHEMHPSYSETGSTAKTLKAANLISENVGRQISEVEKTLEMISGHVDRICGSEPQSPARDGPQAVPNGLVNEWNSRLGYLLDTSRDIERRLGNI